MDSALPDGGIAVSELDTSYEGRVMVTSTKDLRALPKPPLWGSRLQSRYPQAVNSAGL